MFPSGFLTETRATEQQVSPSPLRAPTAPMGQARDDSQAAQAAENAQLKKDLAALRLEAKEAALQAASEKHAAATLRIDLATAERRIAECSARLAAEKTAHGLTKQLLQVEKTKAQQRDTISAADAQATLATLSRDLRQLKLSLTKRGEPLRVAAADEPAPPRPVPALSALPDASAALTGEMRQTTALKPLPERSSEREQDAELEKRLGVHWDTETRAEFEKMRGDRRHGISGIIADCLYIENVPGNPDASTVLATLTTKTNCDGVIFDVSQIGSVYDGEPAGKIRYEIYYHPEHRARVLQLLGWFRWSMDPLYDPLRPPLTHRDDPAAVEVAKARCFTRLRRLRKHSRPETRNCIDVLLARSGVSTPVLAQAIPAKPKKAKRRGKGRQKRGDGAPNGRTLVPYPTMPAGPGGHDETMMNDEGFPARARQARPSGADPTSKRVRQDDLTDAAALAEMAAALASGYLLPTEDDDSEYAPCSEGDDGTEISDVSMT